MDSSCVENSDILSSVKVGYYSTNTKIFKNITSSLVPLNDDTIAIYTWQVNQPAPSQGMTYLSEDEMEKSERFKFSKHKNMYQNSHIVLRYILEQYIGLPSLKIQFETNSFGKPRVIAAQNQHGIHFNLSHTEQLATCVFTKERSVGVDIENSNRIFENDFIIELLTEKERQKFATSKLSFERIVQLWTIKEAWLKLHGMGIGQLHQVPDLSLYDFNLSETAAVFSIHKNTLITYMTEKKHIISIFFN